MKIVYVIMERDLDDNEDTIIGVASTVDRAKQMVGEYFGGKLRILEHRDIRDGGMEFSSKLEVYDHENHPYEVWVWANSYLVDEKIS